MYLIQKGEKQVNLYKIKFEHFAPKGSKAGIITYLIAASDEAVYEWMKSEPKVDGESIYINYGYHEEDEEVFDMYDDKYNVIGQETFKEKMIRLRGDIHDEEADISDAYYGVTLYGWECIKEDISIELSKSIKESGIIVQEILNG